MNLFAKAPSNLPASLAATLLVASAVCLSVGCTAREKSVPVAAPEVPYADIDEVSQLVAGSEGPTLIEFCVPDGCFRCNELRPAINTFAQTQAGRVVVRRVNLNVERSLAAEWGVTVCPTYVLLDSGREVARFQYPTSVDLISATIPNQPSASD